MNRRVLMALPENIASRKDFLFSLYEPFGVVPEQLRNPRTLEEPGAPLYMISNAVPKNLILLDTPDFDTGSRASTQTGKKPRTPSKRRTSLSTSSPIPIITTGITPISFPGC